MGWFFTMTIVCDKCYHALENVEYDREVDEGNEDEIIREQGCFIVKTPALGSPSAGDPEDVVLCEKCYLKLSAEVEKDN